MKYFRLWSPVAIWCGLIFYLSSIPDLSTGWGTWDLILRKIAHMVEYGILFFLTFRAWRNTRESARRGEWLAVAAIFSILYAISDEFHQSFVAGREGSPVDIMIDSAGIITALVGVVKYQRR